ncbi:MAG: hypothetical protein JWM27_2765 [Gemmatimonadetes bacterium]|nr:hypothetical protein [Gemmatimonadota bacterium]
MIATSLLALAAALQAGPVQAPTDTGYFQQGVDYRIEARLDEDAHVLHGRARLRYTNRSPAALTHLYLHQHLNAFRPNSAWARRELELGVRRFQDLGPDDHAFERFTAVQVDGQPVSVSYPAAPDSTVVLLPLAHPLAPGASVTVRMDWDARPSTVPRRQGRAGRHYDFAQWYPRIAVYDRDGWEQHVLMPQGEFYGEFARYDVTLDLPADQVVGSTGVVVDGDPGWTPGPEAQAYPAAPAEALGLLAGQAAEGRKRVRIRADSVHHFAWSVDPTFRHDVVLRSESNDAGENRALPTIHVLYLAADTGWANSAVSHRAYNALAWLQGMFGPYPWPQFTVLHRLDGGGTEFPMLVMNGGPGEGLIVHETSHQYTHGALANNEWKEGWLDEGFASFLTNWYWEEHGNPAVWDRTIQGLTAVERAGRSEPVGWEGARFRDPASYSTMTYGKGSVVLRMLRDMLGRDVMRRVLREYYAQYRLKHVRGVDFQRVAERVSGRDLGWFFAQWIDRTDKLDYAVSHVSSEPLGRGRWRTTVEVSRLGAAWMPVQLQVGDVVRTLGSHDARQTVTLVTTGKPAEVVLDPGSLILDLDRSNNRAQVP